MDQAVSQSVATYVVQAGTVGPIKIGQSVHPVRRIRDLQACCPFQLNFLVALSAKIHPEKEIHAGLDEARIHGEWFTWCREVEQTVRALIDSDGHFRRCPCPRCMGERFTMPLKWRERRALKRLGGEYTDWLDVSELLSVGLAAEADDGTVHVLYRPEHGKAPVRLATPLVFGEPTCPAPTQQLGCDVREETYTW